MEKNSKIQYMCTYCGAKQTKMTSAGRPLPGRCPRRSGDQPHRWVINKKY